MLYLTKRIQSVLYAPKMGIPLVSQVPHKFFVIIGDL